MSQRKYKNLSPEFLKKYEGVDPFPSEIGKFTYMRTYSRYLHEEGRRETWLETVARAVDYNITLGKASKKEAEKLFDNIFNLRQFPSGRTLWIGGTEIAHEYPMANYNCAFTIMDSIESFRDLFYILMIGSGGGFRVLKEDAEKLPEFRTDIELVFAYPYQISKPNRREYTSMIHENNNRVLIEVGDSKEGWTQAVEFYFKLMSEKSYRNVKTIEFDFANVRPKGEVLMRFGGFASGSEPLKELFSTAHSIIKKSDGKLKPIDVVDINNKMGEVIVVGGVRRTSEMAGIGVDDNDSIGMKNDLYVKVGDEWVLNESLKHRQLSNNSIYYYEKPSRDKLNEHLKMMRNSGEPGWVNAEYGQKRRPNFNGVNPCGEILLDSKGMCNLTELNVMAFVVGGFINIPELFEAQRMSARMGMRMTLPSLEIHEWDKVAKRDNLIGCSLTGWQDMVNATDMSIDTQRDLLRTLKLVTDEECKRYAKELGITPPVLSTTIKPSGTLSLLPTVSSGIHYSHSEYYIRRIRVSADDPLAKAMIDKGMKWKPEVGQNAEDCRTIVFEFPVKSPSGRTKSDVSAIEQLENYIMFMEEYVDHNVSITVHVRDHEWDEVEEFVWENWDKIMAVSFIPHNDSFYELLPYETITEAEYNKAMDEIIQIDYTTLFLDDTGKDFDVSESNCDSGICPVR